MNESRLIVVQLVPPLELDEDVDDELEDEELEDVDEELEDEELVDDEEELDDEELDVMSPEELEELEEELDVMSPEELDDEELDVVSPEELDDEELEELAVESPEEVVVELDVVEVDDVVPPPIPPPPPPPLPPTPPPPPPHAAAASASPKETPRIRTERRSVVMAAYITSSSSLRGIFVYLSGRDGSSCRGGRGSAAQKLYRARVKTSEPPAAGSPNLVQGFPSRTKAPAPSSRPLPKL